MACASGIDIDKLLAAPIQVIWVVTSRCNLACSYCLEDAAAASSEDDTSEEFRRLVVAELISNKVLAGVVSGGEPLLVASVPDHVARLRAAGAAVRLTTNGSPVDEDMADRLAASRVTAVDVSCHPGQELVVRRAVSLLVDRGIRTIVRIVLTRELVLGGRPVGPRLGATGPPSRQGPLRRGGLHPLRPMVTGAPSEGRLRELVARFADSGAERIDLREVMPLGRAAKRYAADALDREMLLEVRALVEESRARRGDELVSLTSTTLADIEAGRPVECGLRKGAGRKKVCEIRPDGNVIPCAPAIAFGVENNLKAKGLARAWRNLPRLYEGFAEGPLGGQCASCSLALDGCTGGCRAIARALDGSGGSPFCPLHTAGQEDKEKGSVRKRG